MQTLVNDFESKFLTWKCSLWKCSNGFATKIHSDTKKEVLRTVLADN